MEWVFVKTISWNIDDLIDKIISKCIRNDELQLKQANEYTTSCYIAQLTITFDCDDAILAAVAPIMVSFGVLCILESVQHVVNPNRMSSMG